MRDPLEKEALGCVFGGRSTKRLTPPCRHLYETSLMRLSLAEIEAIYRRPGADFFRLALARTGEVEAAPCAKPPGHLRKREPHTDLHMDKDSRIN